MPVSGIFLDEALFVGLAHAVLRGVIVIADSRASLGRNECGCNSEGRETEAT